MHEKIQLANSHLASGRLTEASLTFQDYLKWYPLEDRVWFFAAGILFRQRRFPEAVEYYRTALRLRPENPDYYADLGAALRADQRVGEAEAMVREAIRRNPTNPLPVFTLANLCSSQRRYEEAERMYRALIEGNPDSLPAIENFGSLLIELNRPTDAMAVFDTYLARHPDDVQVLTYKAIGFDKMGDLDQALEVTERTIVLAPPRRLEMRLASYMSLVGRTGRLDLRPRVLDLVTDAIPATLPDAWPERWFEADRNALRRFTYLFPYYGIRDRDLLKVHRALGNQIADSFPPMPTNAPPRSGKLRVGFISYNFGNHPIGHLLSVFFEAHSASETELFL